MTLIRSGSAASPLVDTDDLFDCAARCGTSIKFSSVDAAAVVAIDGALTFAGPNRAGGIQTPAGDAAIVCVLATAPGDIGADDGAASGRAVAIIMAGCIATGGCIVRLIVCASCARIKSAGHAADKLQTGESGQANGCAGTTTGLAVTACHDASVDLAGGGTAGSAAPSLLSTTLAVRGRSGFSRNVA